jgi:hypothetical protein
MAALIAVGSVGCVLTSSQQLVPPLLLSPVLANTAATPVEGLTGRQARTGETKEKPLARKLVNPPQVFSSTSYPLSKRPATSWGPWGSFGVLGGPGKSWQFLNIRLAP